MPIYSLLLKQYDADHYPKRCLIKIFPAKTEKKNGSAMVAFSSFTFIVGFNISSNFKSPDEIFVLTTIS